MRIKAVIVYLFFLISCIPPGLFAANSAETDPYPAFIIPIYNGGYNLQEYFDASEETKTVRYYIQIGHPPAEVIEFYDAYFNGKGWRSSFEICQRNWEGLSKGTKNAEHLSRQLFASWEHSEFNLKAVLWLTYEMVDKGRQYEVIVKCRLQPKDVQ